MDKPEVKSRIPKKTIGQKVWKFFSSPRLAIVLMILLAGISILGTLMPQGRKPGFYIEQFGPDRAWWVLTLGLANLYYTWWFLTILMLLNVNIFVCFYGRFPQKYKSFGKTRVDIAKAYIVKQRSSVSLTVREGMEAASEAVAKALKRQRYRVSTHSGEGSVAFLGSKGLIGRFGSDITHIAFLIIIGGAVFGNLLGFKDFVAIFEGDTKYIEQGGFYLRLDDFDIEYYPESSRPKDYKSTLTVVEGGEDKLTKTIEVNDPLIYKDIWFYQSSYGKAWAKVKEATFQVFERESGDLIGQYSIPFGKARAVSEDGLKLKMVSFVADFTYDMTKRRVLSKSSDHNNPAVLVEVYEDGKLTARPWIFLNYPDAHAFQSKDSKYFIRMVNYRALPYTGLQVARDPGVNVVWLGCFLLTAGLFISFFVFHKRVWVRLEDGESGTAVVLGGNTNKNVIAFEKEFQSLVKELRASLEREDGPGRDLEGKGS
jgi:cytochrome c biogenesis protein